MSVFKIKCAEHLMVPAWLACDHVLRRETGAEHVQLPKKNIKDDVGVVCCKSCLRAAIERDRAGLGPPRSDATRIVCDRCLRDVFPGLPNVEES